MKFINASELEKRMENSDDWLLLDVLPAEHYEREHIPGAHSAPVNGSNFIDRAEALADSKQDTVIVYCANQECDLSPKAAKKLEDNGFADVLDFDGGIEEWKKAGFDVTNATPAGSER